MTPDIRTELLDQARALTTTDSGILAYVLWRGDLYTKPVWSDPGLPA